MKHTLSLIIALALACPLFSQPGNRCPYNEPQLPATNPASIVGDFTITTTDGITRNLYTALDSGKTVFIDLFFTTCSWCQTYAPIIETIYQNTGAGQNDIEFWGISNNLNDTDPLIDQYKLNYNVTNPCAGPQGGGTTAHTTVIAGQNFLGWPTYCVICPNRTMYFDPVYPPTVTGFYPYFENCADLVGVPELNPPVTGTIATVYPNPASREVTLDVYTDISGELEINLVSMTGSAIIHELREIQAGNSSFIFDLPSHLEGMYILTLKQDGKTTQNTKVLVQR